MEELIRIGAYRAGADAEVDRAIALNPALEAFLSQDKDEIYLDGGVVRAARGHTGAWRMRWADQLIKLSNFELELLQARLADVGERRQRSEMKLAVLDAEGETEMALARADPEAGWRMEGFAESLRRRKLLARRELDLNAQEEAGVRDAIAEAFETLKKYEQVADNARVAAEREAARRENAVLDEMGLRRATGRR